MWWGWAWLCERDGDDDVAEVMVWWHGRMAIVVISRKEIV